MGLSSAAAALGVVSVVVLLTATTVQRTEAWNEFCQIRDVTGIWKISRDLRTDDNYRQCNRIGWSTLEHRIRLSYPDIAEDEYGNYGHWTLIYGVAIEIQIHGRKYFTFFPWYYRRYVGWQVDCRNLEVGSSTDVLTNNYACFNGRKLYWTNDTKKGEETEDEVDPKPDPTVPTLKGDGVDGDAATENPPTFLNHDPTPTDIPKEESRKHKLDYELVDRINNHGLGLWEAEAYDHLKDIDEKDMVKMAGGNMTLRGRPPKPAPMTEEQLEKLKLFPRSFDWRNVDGVNYISPVRNQGYCGSCYAFAALGAYEARFRIMTGNTVQPVLSPQDIVNCNPYTYGCWGGWIFTEGKYAEEFGFIDESCNPYSAEDETCERDSSKCQRYYGTNYQYIGGFFGGSNEFLMMDAILNNGPVVVGFAVYHDMFYYRRGIYYHAGPDWLMGYHAVIVVGWGQDERSGTKYWIIKNSWGKGWGEDGFFRMIRGSNDCDIEAETFEAFPII